jgi:hypothetical protein
MTGQGQMRKIDRCIAKGKDAPEAAVRGIMVEPLESTRTCRSRSSERGRPGLETKLDDTQAWSVAFDVCSERGLLHPVQWFAS